MPCIGDNRRLTQESKLIVATDMPLGKHTVCALRIMLTRRAQWRTEVRRQAYSDAEERQNESCAINW
jgi:hypothetical protein